jgi:flavin reductase (DIM6/NTAB) family NADH-FMN oxidoreductase RutF
MHITKADIENTPRIKRLNLINSITGVKPANLIGTISEGKTANLAIFSSIVHLGSNPASIGFILRPQRERKTDTYRNILNEKYYTINHVHSSFIEKAHYSSVKFAENESEFDFLEMQEEYVDGFVAPFHKGSNLKIGMKLQEMIPLPNGCIFVVGSVEHVFIKDDFMSEDGILDLEKMDDVGISGLNSYYSLKKIGQFPYAKKNEIPPNLIKDNSK